MKKLIIGATGSIGSSLAKKIIAEGGEVHLVGRDESSLSNLASPGGIAEVDQPTL